MILEQKKSVVRDYFVRNRVSFGLLLGSGVLIFMRPGSQRVIFAGLFVSFVGLLIRSWAAGCIKKSKSLCTEGPYAFVRHPLYLGSLLMSSGIVVVFTSTDSLWLSGIFWATYTLYYWSFYTAAVTTEEKLLAERFADEWPYYKKNVPAFFPFRLARFKNLSFTSFSFAQYFKNKEYNAVAGWTAIAVLIFILGPLQIPRPDDRLALEYVREDVNQPIPLQKVVSSPRIQIAKALQQVKKIKPPQSQPEPTKAISQPMIKEDAIMEPRVVLADNDEPLEEPRRSRKLSLVTPWFGNAVLGTSALSLFNAGTGSDAWGASAQTASAFTLASVVSEQYDSIWIGVMGYGLASAVGLSQGQNLGSDVMGGAFMGIVIGKSLSYFDRKKGWSKRVSSDGRSVTYKQRF